jgi:hypothetical protein
MLPPQPQFSAVGHAQSGHRALPVQGEVLDPLAHFAHRAAADVGGNVGFAAELVAQVEELVGAEAVGLDHAAPVGVDHGGALFGRADSIAPVVFVGEAAARPAQDGDADRSQGRDDVAADPAHVGDGRIRPDPEPVVDAAPEVLGEVAVDVAADPGFAAVGADGECILYGFLSGHAVSIDREVLKSYREDAKNAKKYYCFRDCGFIHSQRDIGAEYTPLLVPAYRIDGEDGSIARVETKVRSDSPGLVHRPSVSHRNTPFPDPMKRIAGNSGSRMRVCT